MGATRRHRLVAGVATALAALVIAAPAAAFDPAGSVRAITDYFSTVQGPDGNVLDPVRGAGHAPRYSQAMLGASALAVGRRDFALRALDYVAAHPESNADRPSVFEIGAAAAAYNALAGTPDEPVRARLAAWLATAPA
jgi:hypothetical protein